MWLYNMCYGGKCRVECFLQTFVRLLLGFGWGNVCMWMHPRLQAGNFCGQINGVGDRVWLHNLYYGGDCRVHVSTYLGNEKKVPCWSLAISFHCILEFNEKKVPCWTMHCHRLVGYLHVSTYLGLLFIIFNP